MHFAWVTGLKGPEPVKFDADVITPKNTLIVYKLNDDEAQLILRDLEVRYPFKE